MLPGRKLPSRVLEQDPLQEQDFQPGQALRVAAKPDLHQEFGARPVPEEAHRVGIIEVEVELEGRL